MNGNEFKTSLEKAVKCGIITQEQAEAILPELKSKDKEMIEIIRGAIFTATMDETTRRDALAWLEEQGEQKLFNNDKYQTVSVKILDRLYGSEKELERLKQGEQKPVPFKAEHGKYYYCIRNYFSGGKKRASKGDVVQALRGLPIMGLDDASEFFLPVNNMQFNKIVNPNDLPKFKVGDWITDNKNTFQIVGDENNWYCADDGDKIRFDIVHKFYHLWTIQDAKDGDVLDFDCGIGIFKNISTDGYNAHCYCYYDRNSQLETDARGLYLYDVYKAEPATKEQRDLLFQKMEEAGYEWDAEKKELRKIEQKSVDEAEPKFKVGDWVVTKDGKVNQVKTVSDDGDAYTLDDGTYFSGSWKDMYHLWTIQDAKDGDVLTHEGSIFMIKSYALWYQIVYHCCYTGKVLHKHGLYHFWTREDFGNVHPATQEQRDLLFLTMKEEGYEWGADKKELKKIEQHPADKVEPKFKIGDTIHYIGERTMFPMVIEEIKDGDYVCDNESSFVNIKFQDKYELVEPKFKAGDWIIRNSEHTDVPVQVIEFKGYYRCELNGKVVTFTFNDVHNDFHLWTIQDAKDGDVLAEHETIVLFKTIEGLNIKCYCTYHYLGYNPTLYVDTLQNKEPYRPATKEQRDLLFQKMKEAEYEWDADKKELRKIEQKPAWSEEDEEMLRRCISATFDHGYLKECDWLKSLKSRVQLKSKSEWSEEDEKKRKGLIKGLKDRMGFGWASDPFSREEYINWLKSLEERYTWKPSDEQMKQLHKYCPDNRPLTQLYEDLKKLKG